MEKEIKNKFWDGRDCRFIRFYDKTFKMYYDLMQVGMPYNFNGNGIDGSSLRSICGYSPILQADFEPFAFIYFWVKDGEIEDGDILGAFVEKPNFLFKWDMEKKSPVELSHFIELSMGLPIEYLNDDFDFNDLENKASIAFSSVCSHAQRDMFREFKIVGSKRDW